MRAARFVLPAALALLAAAACTESTSTDVPFDDAAVTDDIAASAGEDIAVMIGTMIDNESFAAGGAQAAGGVGSSSLDISRSVDCYDANDDAVSNCMPFSSVRMIAIHLGVDGSRSSTRKNRRGGTVTWAGAVHRVADDTTRRIFTDATETSRVHTAVSSGHDTTTFADDVATRKLAETVLDSVRALTFNLPRSSSPLPVSGSIVRHVAATVEITSGDKQVAKDVSHRIEVVFPADAQGNVTLNIDAISCQLNLLTHAVTGCQ